MEINDPNPLMSLNNGVKPEDSSKQPDRNRKDGNKRPDSNRAKSSIRDSEISNLNEQLRYTPDIRRDRVKELRKKIKGGTYNIKADKIAAKIIKGNPLDDIT